ncbi:hypothetical protein Tco_0091403 [Tanacetum coccineum]
MFEDNSYKAHEEEARKKKRKKHAAPRTPSGSPPSPPPPLPPSAGASRATGISGALGSSLLPPPPPPSSTADSRQDWWKPIPEEERLATPEPAWTIPSSSVLDIEHNWASALVSTYETPTENSLLSKTRDMAYEVVKAFYPDVIHLQFQMEECHKMLIAQVDWMNPEGDQVRIDVNRPLPLGGPPGHVTIQPQFFFNKDLEYLRYDSKGSNPALSISKMKAASYPDFGLKLLVPEQMWIDDVCTYDIMSSESKIRNLYPSDFEDLNLLLLQDHLDHLSGSDKRMLSTAVKLWTRNLVIRQRVEDFQLGIESYQT